ncbi:MAG: hypothetical protein FVQ85_07255 [Planctomycetes bacterium]|nr:hypothetical protein [Planctomycetota bacterium]
MKKVLRKSNLVVGVLILIAVCLGIVFASDGIVKQGVIEGVKFKSTGSTATGLNAVALGYETEATGAYSFSMGYETIASGSGLSTALGCWTQASAPCSTAMGFKTTASGYYSTALGSETTASDYYTTAMGYNTTASQDYSTAMGYATDANGGTSTAMGFQTTASGSISTAMGYKTKASGDYSTAMGWQTLASGDYSTATGFSTTATGDYSVAMGEGVVAGSASNTTAIGKSFTNNVQDSFAVGFEQMDFRVESGKVTVGDRDANKGILVVGNYVDANDYLTHSSFYDKDTYGNALDYSQDSSNTIKLNAAGQNEYDHEADPEFVQRWVTVTDYDNYTEHEVWDEALERNITRRTYQTHQELRSNLGMKVAWLRQCVYELKQENQVLKGEIAQLKAAVGIE